MTINEEFQSVKDFAFFPPHTLDAFKILSNQNGTNYELLRLIDTDFQMALSEKDLPRLILMAEDKSIAEDIKSASKVYFITSFKTKRGDDSVVMLFKKNRNPNLQPLELENVLSESEYNTAGYIDLGTKPKDMLYHFAHWPTYNADLKVLKELARQENWSFVSTPNDDDFPILKSYITYTFSKLWSDGGVTTSPTMQHAVFNTGLVNRNYQYIYALFEKNIGDKPWRFLQFCIPGIKRGGRLLAENFPALPKPAHYFNDISDVVYIISKERTPDEQLPDIQQDHYFIDHPDRLPRHFLLDTCRKSEPISKLLDIDTSKYTAEELRQYWTSIGEAISDDEDVYDDLEASFRNAVRKAVMRVSWNYRTAIPIYFPTNHKMSILLPLTFSNDTDAEIALVVEKNPISQKYSAPTILNLKMAYSNARLVCKPESDWLNQGFFSKVQNDKDDDE